MGVKRSQENEVRTGGGATKKAKTDPALEEVVKEIEVVAQSQQLPDGCRAVLVALARGGLSTPADKRHTYQVTAVEKVGETMRSRCGVLENAIKEAEAKIAERDDVKNAIEAARANTKVALESKSKVMREMKVSLADVTKQVIAAQKKLKEAEAAQEAGDATRNETKVEKEHLEVTLAEHLTSLRESACGEASHHLKAILALGSKLDMDDHLMNALPNAVMMEPSQRRRFDLMSLDLVETLIKEKITGLEKELEVDAPESAEREAIVKSMRDALAHEKALLLTAAADFRSANTDHQKSLDTMKEVEKRERDFKRNTQALHQTLNDCQVDLDIFKSGAQKSFETLRDRQEKQPSAATPSKADAEQSGLIEEQPTVAVGGQ